MKRFVSGLVLATVLFLAAFGLSGCRAENTPAVETSQTTAPTISPAAADDNINRPVSEPYKGDLSIFESPERAKNLQINRVMDILKISEGKAVADIGAGSGWFTVLAAKRTGAGGKVFAVEINQDYINHINERAKKENLPNIQTVLGTEDDPQLAENSIDAALILKTYHEIGQPVKVLENLRKSFKKDALLGIIDRNGNGADHGINEQQVIEEARRAGFTKIDEYDFTKADGMDYFLVFRAAQ